MSQTFLLFPKKNKRINYLHKMSIQLRILATLNYLCMKHNSIAKCKGDSQPDFDKFISFQFNRVPAF